MLVNLMQTWPQGVLGDGCGIHSLFQKRSRPLGGLNNESIYPNSVVCELGKQVGGSIWVYLLE